MLRSHLFDIDILINRTLVYGTLTAIVVALYFGGIVVWQRLFVVLTGEKSTLAVVASTHLIAALFTPLRGSPKGSAGELLATYRTGLAPLSTKKGLRKDNPKRLYLVMGITRSVTGMSQKHITCEYAASVLSTSGVRLPPTNGLPLSTSFG
ncbi:MAG TPA: hypothetical protein VKA82_17255 [Rubrobacter sp.]|nr:hypothetical protein [Rubrobacter sp.]